MTVGVARQVRAPRAICVHMLRLVPMHDESQVDEWLGNKEWAAGSFIVQESGSER